jgi:hypothetical protein
VPARMEGKKAVVVGGLEVPGDGGTLAIIGRYERWETP